MTPVSGTSENLIVLFGNKADSLKKFRRPFLNLVDGLGEKYYTSSKKIDHDQWHYEKDEVFGT